MTAATLLAALLAARSARAEEWLVLPTSEDPAAWRDALAVTGLRPGAVGRTASGDDRVIRVEPSAGVWVLRASDASGTVRTARVAAPASAGDREEVAHLALALARDLGPPHLRAPAATAATAVRATTPPPPPLRVEPPRPASGVPPRQIHVDPPLAAIPESPTGGRPEGDAELVLISFPPREAPGPAASIASAPGRKPLRLRAPQLRSPPLRASSAVLLRPDTMPAFFQSLGWEPLKLGDTVLSIDLGFGAPRSLLLRESELFRSYFAWHFDAAVAVPVGPLELGPIGGLQYRLYRQQFRPVDEGVAAALGLRVTGNFFALRRWSWSPTLQAVTDGGTTRLVLEDGTEHTLFPIEVLIGLRARFGGSVDPKRDRRTSTD